MTVRIIVVEGRYRSDIADELLKGAREALKIANADHDLITVPGCLEVPQALAMGFDTGWFDGGIGLGCVMRGETYHFDIVANESARGIMQLAVETRWPIGNGIITADTADQADVRARIDGHDVGGGAVRACLSLIDARRRFVGGEDG